MNWTFINTGINTGMFNMDFDVELARNSSPGNATFRLYRWKPYCISLGANQKFEDIKTELALKDLIDIVKRPTGGRAILHSEELTYSVVLPVSSGFSSQEIYIKISHALIRGLKTYDSRLNDAELETIQPDFAGLLKDPSGILCFSSTAKSEVKFRGKKLIGSAQRKMNNAILQHGSIICGDHHQKLVDYLNIETAEVEKIKQDLQKKTISIKSIIDEEVNYFKLAAAIEEGFNTEWNIKEPDLIRS